MREGQIVCKPMHGFLRYNGTRTRHVSVAMVKEQIHKFYKVLIEISRYPIGDPKIPTALHSKKKSKGTLKTSLQSSTLQAPSRAPRKNIFVTCNPGLTWNFIRIWPSWLDHSVSHIVYTIDVCCVLHCNSWSHKHMSLLASVYIQMWHFHRMDPSCTTWRDL